MAIICREHKLLFIMAPRTACSATGKVLCEKLGGEYIPFQDIVDSDGHFKVQKKHSTLSELIENKLISKEKLSDYLKFTCVRNPYDLIVSEYVKRKVTYQPLLKDPDSWVHKVPKYKEGMNFCKENSFEDWVVYRHSTSLAKRIQGKGKKSIFEKFTNEVDEIMKFENLQEDFQRVLSKAGIEQKLNVPVFNKTIEKDKNYQDYYTKRSKKIIDYVYQKDIKKYKYVF
ncbi:MAG: sulfotransferase family 2 domain-containing protein [Cyanobacteria bacterium J06621_3]